MERANRLKASLTKRGVHADVLRFCEAELLQENYFHAVFEAMKSVAAKIRDISGLDGDGTSLVEKAFSFGESRNPVLAINTFTTETQQGEQLLD